MEIDPLKIFGIFVGLVVIGVLFVLGFLLGEYLHGLGSNLWDAMRQAWDRLFTPGHTSLSGTTPGGSVSSVYRNECANGRFWDENGRDGGPCIDIDGPLIA